MVTQQDNFQSIANLPSGCFEAMEAAFALCEAIESSELTTEDLHNTVRLAVADGHDMMMICLLMMIKAIEGAKEGGNRDHIGWSSDDWVDCLEKVVDIE